MITNRPFLISPGRSVFSIVLAIALFAFTATAASAQQSVRTYTVSALLKLGGTIVGTSETRIWVAFDGEIRQSSARWYVCTYDVNDPTVSSSCVEYR